MDEKLKEALINAVDKRIASLENDKKGLETELTNSRLYENEENGFTQDLDKVNEELEIAKNEKKEIEQLDEEHKKLKQELDEKNNKFKLRMESLLKDKEQLEEEKSDRSHVVL